MAIRNNNGFFIVNLVWLFVLALEVRDTNGDWSNGAAVVRSQFVLYDDRPDHHADIYGFPAGTIARFPAVDRRQIVPGDKGRQFYPTVVGGVPVLEGGREPGEGKLVRGGVFDHDRTGFYHQFTKTRALGQPNPLVC